MSESPEPSRKRSRKAKLVPRECIEYVENNSTMQEPELAVQALLPKLRTGIDRDDEAFANPAPAPMEFSINVEVEEFEEETSYEPEVKSDDKSLRQCVIEESVIRRDIEELSQTTTSLADKQLEIEIRNHWGKILKPIQETPFETAIQYAVNRWRTWNALSKFRETFLQYKCYICETGWWHLMPFQDHIKQHDGVKVNVEFCHHECSMIAYVKQEEDMRDVPIEGDCWKCLKTQDEHIASKRRSNVYYFCDACNGNFFTCTALMEHEGICQKYHKTHLKNEVRHESDWLCSICYLKCLTKVRYDAHMIRRHLVRSDLVIATASPKYCITCDGKYMSYNLHICCRKPDNYQCSYCCRRFQNRYLSSLHESMTKNDYYCPVCNKYLKKQCMELEHMVKHSRNYTLAYKCALCEENILFPNENSLRRHRVIWHGLKQDKRRGYLDVMVVPKRSLNCTKLEIVASVQGNFTIINQPETTTASLPTVTVNIETNDGADKQPCMVQAIADNVILDDIQRMQETEQNIDESADIKNEIEEAENAIASLLQETLNKKRDSVDLGTDTFDGVDVKTEIKVEKEDYEELEEQTDDHHNSYEDIDIEIKKEQEEYIETLSKVFQASKSVENRKMSNASVLKEELTKNEMKPDPESRSLLRVQYKKGNGKLIKKEKNLTQGRSVLLQNLSNKDNKTDLLNNEKNLTQGRSVLAQALLNKDNKTDLLNNEKNLTQCRSVLAQALLNKDNKTDLLNTEKNLTQCRSVLAQDLLNKDNKTDLLNNEKNLTQGRLVLAQNLLNKDNKKDLMNKEKNLTKGRSVMQQDLLNKDKNTAANEVIEVQSSSQTVNEKGNASQTVNKELERKPKECIIKPRVYVRKARKPKVPPNALRLQEELLIAEKEFRASNVSEMIDADYTEEELTAKNIVTQESKHITRELISHRNIMRGHNALEKVLKPSQSNIELQDVEVFISKQVVIKNEPMDEDEEYEDDIIVLNSSFNSTNSENLQIKHDPYTSDVTSETSVSDLKDMSNLEPDVKINKKKNPAKGKQRKTYKCTNCPFEAPHKEYHEHKLYVCPRKTSSQKGKVYISHKNLWRQYPCTKCNEIHPSLRSYIDHLTKTHHLAKLACPQCASVQLTPSALVSHIMAHIKLSFVRIHMIRASACVTTKINGVFSCKECSESVPFREFFSHWEAHMVLKVAKDEVESADEREVGPGGKVIGLPPDELNKVIVQLTTPWDRHQRASTLGEQLKNCVVCGRLFGRRNDVKRHLIEHLLVDAYGHKWRHQALRCQMCGDKFQKADKYKQHMRQHASLPLYKCELCNHAFSDSSNFAKHKKVHNLRCMVCDICGKKFNAKTQLQRHIELHAIMKPIQCGSCTKIFYSESTFKKHYRSAHEKRHRYPFLCVICQMRFNSLKEKWDHMWHVHKERKFKADCPFCDQSFRKFADVKSHVRNAHRIRLMRSKEDETVIMYEYE